MDAHAGQRDTPPARLAMQGNTANERKAVMSIYEQMCRERRWLDHRTPLPLGQVMPPPPPKKEKEKS